MFGPQPGHHLGWASRLPPARGSGRAGRTVRVAAPRPAGREQRRVEAPAARPPGSAGPRNFSRPPQRLRQSRGREWGKGGRRRLTPTASGSSRPECGWGAVRRRRASRLRLRARGDGGSAGPLEERRRRRHRRQLRNMAARRLLGGKAGLPRAPRLPLPAGRPRAAAGEPTPPPRQPLAPRPAPRAPSRLPRGASPGVAVRDAAARETGCGRRSPEGNGASAEEGGLPPGRAGLE